MPRIPGTHGDWDFDVKDPDPDNSGRASVSILYSPRGNKCRAVRIVQTVKTVGFTADKKRKTDPDDIYSDPTDNPDHGKRNHKKVNDDSGEPVGVDYRPCAKDPYVGTVGIPGDDFTLPNPGGFTDAPGGPWDKIKPGITKIEMLFEVCAVCVATGEILGCLTWKMTTSRNDQPKDGSQASDIELTSPKESLPSDTFKKALKAFTKSHTKKDPKDKKLKWYCPDRNPANQGSLFGGEVPDGFRERVIDSGSKRTHRLGSLRLGHGPHFETPEDARFACASAPWNLALKFTWGGFQIRTTPTLILTSVVNLLDEDIAPFVERRPPLANDVTSIHSFWVTQELLESFAESLFEESISGKEGSGPILLTVIARVRGPESKAFTVHLEPHELIVPLQRAATHPDVDAEVIEALDYLALNMAHHTLCHPK